MPRERREAPLATGAPVSHYYVHGRLVARRDGSGVKYFHSDHLGSTNLATYPGGALVPLSETDYLPYGETRTGGTGLPTDRRFTGQRQDSYINLYQMGSRWYDPSLGRWIQPDTIVPDPGNPQSLNRYAYGVRQSSDVHIMHL